MEWNEEVRKGLRRLFPANAVKWLAVAVRGDEALAVAYIDARTVMERLDRVVGPSGWGDEYEIIAATPEEYVVECRLTVLGVTKADVGDSSASGSENNLAKTAYSDALKRAAVKFGVGRYLYTLPKRWVAYDAQRKRLAEEPQLPAWAVPGTEAEDPGEDAPFEEQEAPLKPREEKTIPTATANPGEYVLQFGKKHKGETLAAIHAEDADYLDWLAEKSNAKPPVKLAVKTFLAWRQGNGHIDADQPQPHAGEGDGPHWSADDKARRRFWASAKGMKVSEDEVHVLLVGDSDGHLADYPGGAGDALTLCREWAVEQGRIAR